MKIEIIQPTQQSKPPIKFPVLVKSNADGCLAIFWDRQKGIKFYPTGDFEVSKEWLPVTEERTWKILPPGTEVIFTQE